MRIKKCLKKVTKRENQNVFDEHSERDKNEHNGMFILIVRQILLNDDPEQIIKNSREA